MLESWLNFAIVVFAQLVLFVAHAYYVNRLTDIPRLLGLGVLIGLVMGLLYDLFLGKFLGLASYELGFGAIFLVINGALSYGIFAANVLLLQHARLRDFFLLTVVVVVVYEVTNNFLRVWTWRLEHLLAFSSSVEFIIVLLIGYFTGAIFVAAVAHKFFQYRFSFINNLLKNRRGIT